MSPIKNLLSLNDKELDDALQDIIAKNQATYKIWTAKEEKILRTLKLAHIPMAVIAKQLDRSYSSVMNHWMQIRNA